MCLNSHLGLLLSADSVIIFDDILVLIFMNLERSEYDSYIKKWEISPIIQTSDGKK